MIEFFHFCKNPKPQIVELLLIHKANYSIYNSSRLTPKMIAEKNGGAPVIPVVVKENKLYECEDQFDFMQGN